MPFVMFDVYTAHALGLNGTDSEELANQLDRQGASGLAGRVRYGLANNTLVELDDDEDREALAQALDALDDADPHEPEQVRNLARNVRARIAGADLPAPPDAA